jgi:CBS domain-containing protein
MSASVKDIMTPSPIAVRPDSPLMAAANLLVAKDFRGLPVTDAEGRVLGILTEYDLIIKGSSLHLPTFIKLMQEIDLYGHDASLISDEMKQIMEMKVQDAMNQEPFTMLDSASVEEVAKTFAEHHKINPLLVVDTQNKLVGIVSRRDLIKTYGNYSIRFADEHTKERKVDVNVNKFLKGFERRFIIVSRFRTRTWVLFSAMFFLIGFLVAFALIVRINV